MIPALVSEAILRWLTSPISAVDLLMAIVLLSIALIEWWVFLS